MKLCEHFPAFLFLLKLPENLSRTQAFPVRVYLARVLEKPFHGVDFLGCILQLILHRIGVVVTLDRSYVGLEKIPSSWILSAEAQW